MSKDCRYLDDDLVAIRERDATTNLYTTRYQHNDALGSALVETDANRAVLTRTEYEPYGLSNRPTLDGPGFTGHVQDAATGLTYMQQRYYDPVIGRFLSVDPVTAYGSGNWRLFNRYAYAYNNPYRFTDPDGRCPNCIGGVIGGVVGGIGGGVVGLVSSGGDWKATVAGAVGGAVGGAITGGTLGAGAGAGQIAAAGITAGILGELSSETAENALNHGADTESWTYSPGKIVVSGTLGVAGGYTGQLIDDIARPALNRAQSGLLNEATMLVPNVAFDIVINAHENPVPTVTVGEPQVVPVNNPPPPPPQHDPR